MLCLNTDSKKLKRTIEQATWTAEPSKAGLCYTAGRQPESILAVPAARLAGVACAIIPEPLLAGSTLMELFNVKPAENAAVELLVRGMTPGECALYLDMPIATTRTHLSALYRKTHTRHQAELLLILRAIHG